MGKGSICRSRLGWAELRTEAQLRSWLLTGP